MDVFKGAAADRHLVDDRRTLLPHQKSQLPEIFNIEDSNVVIAILNIYYKFPNWSVKIQPFDPILKAFENIARIQYFFEKPFFISFVVRNYSINLAIVFRIDN